MDSLRPDDALADKDSGPAPKKRDVFIAILAVLHLITACWRLYQENRIIVLYIYYSSFDDPNLSVWGPPLPLIALAELTALFVLAAGIGLWLNAKWGWWLTGFVYSYAVLQAIYMIVMSYVRNEELQQIGLQFDLAPSHRNLVIYSLLFCYLQTNRVLRSFGLQLSARLRWKFIAAQFGAAITDLIITTLLSLLILTSYGQSVPYIE